MKRIKYYSPVLLGAFPALSLLATNIAQVSPVDSLRSIVVSILFSLLIFLVAFIIFRDSLRASILAAIVVFLFFSYGHVYQLVMDTWLFGFHLGRHRFLLALWIFLLLVGILWLRKPKDHMFLIGKALNIISVLLILVPLFQIFVFELVQKERVAKGSSEVQMENVLVDSEDGQIPASTSSDLPDIYYFILDMYTRQDVLEHALGFDNSAFLNQLKDLGFYVAECSQSNYDSTVLSLGSSLNLDYFQHLLGEDYDPKWSPYLYGDLVKNNLVRNILEGQGYSIIAVESGFSPTEWSDADVYLAPEKNLLDLAFGNLNSFESMFLRTSPAILLFSYFHRLPIVVRTGIDSAYMEHRERILFALDEMDAIPQYPNPKFVFVHILAPHNPFVFGPNGEFVRRDTLFTLNQDPESDTWPEIIEGYTAQITYLNTRLIEILTHILTTSDSPPVIIIQGDHGIPKFRNLAGRLAILSAYYLPNSDTSGLYSSISPINSFRYLLDTYFGTDYGMLEDLSYVASDVNVPLDFEIVSLDEDACPFRGDLDY